MSCFSVTDVTMMFCGAAVPTYWIDTNVDCERGAFWEHSSARHHD